MKFIHWASCAALLVALTTLPSCKKIPNDGIPFYLQIDSTFVVIDDPKQGTASSKITDVWVESGADNLGAYECPIQIPVLKEGKVPFLLSAGIKNNGSVGFRKIYDFLQPDTFTIFNAQRGQVYKRNAYFHYKPGLKFYVENFEGGVNTSTLDITTTDVFEGSKSGVLQLNASDTAKAAKFQTIAIPAGQAVYAELNYKCTMPFTLGLLAIYGTSVQPIPKITFNVKPEWNKTYIDLSYEVGQTAAPQYQLYIYAEKNLGETHRIMLDNLKILHY